MRLIILAIQKKSTFLMLKIFSWFNRLSLKENGATVRT